LLSRAEWEAAQELAYRVRRWVPADLVQSSLFGSKARREARPDSDVDLLLVFRELPPDREPQAGQAEEIAEAVARESGIPVTVWSVSMIDLVEGRRTPMLVDALADAVPLWWAVEPLPAVPFTPADALRCSGALLQRVDEGSEEFALYLRRGDTAAAARRLRDDVVRLATAALLLRGETRPRRGDAARRFATAELRGVARPEGLDPLLGWAATSFGPEGRDEDRAVAVPPGGLRAAGSLIPFLEGWIRGRADRLSDALADRNPSAG
jgi:predicted nucleotidyltransferase